MAAKRIYTPEASAHRRELSAQWRKAHPDKVKRQLERKNAARRQRIADDPEYAAARAASLRTWRMAHPDTIQQHRQTGNAVKRRRLAEDPGYAAKLNQKARTRSRNHTGQKNERNARYAAEKWGALINDFTDAQWKGMQAMYTYRCVYCPLSCQACKKKSHALTRDHITALSKGGNHTASNILPACRRCNSKKGVKTPAVPVQPVLLMQAPPKKGRSLVAGFPNVEEEADGWIRITLPKGVVLKLSRFEFALGLRRGKSEQRALRQAVREQRHLSQQEADLLAWIDSA